MTDYRKSYQEPAPIVRVNITGSTIEPTLISVKAREAAEACSRGKAVNTSSQIRRFYDELVMWNERVLTAKDPEAKFTEVAPYIQMLCAKCAYAKGRKLIDETFDTLLSDLISQIKTPETLKRAKLFFEAFLGFKKAIES